MNAAQAKSIKLVDLMELLGFEIKKVERGRSEHKYLSPFRPDEAEPSFNVNLPKNAWFDFGEGQEGNTLDFAIAYLRSQGRSGGVSDALAWLTTVTGSKPPQRAQIAKKQEFSSSQQSAPPARKSQIGDMESNLTFIKAHPITNPIIFTYLLSRGISRVLASKYFQEVHYRHTKTNKEYYGFAMQNECGGWEIRAASDDYKFKSALNGRDVTLIDGSNPQGVVNVFEGMVDFVSYLVLAGVGETPPKEDMLVLHSLSSLKRANALITEKGYERINTFLDNNRAGMKATTFLIQGEDDKPGLVTISGFGSRIVDHSSTFTPYEDLNDALRSGHVLPINHLREIDEPRVG